MSTEDFTKNGLLTYLRESAVSGLLNPAVARSRKTAAEQLLFYISPEEKLNLRLLDVDELCSRIHKLEDSSIRFEALNLYNARLKSALKDYFSWLDDPEHFVSTSVSAVNNKQQKAKNTAESKALEDITLSDTYDQDGIIPIPLRDDLCIYVKDLPLDLTQKEAQKIANVIHAYAQQEKTSE